MRYHPRHPRKAFTLIELIVVIAIIVVLASLTIGAIGKSYVWIRQKNTEQTMTKVIQRLQRVADRLRKDADDWPSATEQLFILDQAAGSAERAQVLKALYLYKWNFPNSYNEAFRNVQESQTLYHPNGYPPARALFEKLRTNNPAYFAALPATVSPADFPRQNSACLLAAFVSANGSPDEFTGDEVQVNNTTGDNNPYLTDNWGNPLIFLRHGNFVANWKFGYVTDLVPFSLLPTLLGNNYFNEFQRRSYAAYSNYQGSDPFDNNRLLQNSSQWGNNSFPSGGWYTATWLLPTVAASPNLQFFRANFGYAPENIPNIPEAFCPMVIISAGGDKNFATWDDNLDSYRLQINVSGQQ